MSQVILGISCYYHDAAACLMIDDTIVAAALEERFSRIKHDNAFPKQSISYCLEWAGIHASDISAVVFYEKPVVKFERIIAQHLDAFPASYKAFRDTIGQWLSFKLQLPKTLKKHFGYTGRVYYTSHHMSHAACAYYLSGFDTSTILTIDGVGEWATTTIGFAKNGVITLDNEIRFPHSLGLLYSAITAYLGFEVNDAEYKVMGLAAYGDPKPYAKQVDELVKLFPDGSYALNLPYFTFNSKGGMYSKKLEALFGLPARLPESGMTAAYENIAASLQQKLEDMIVHVANYAYTRHATKNLCLSGGVALNSVANGKLLGRTKFTRVFIPPDPGDGGGAMGAALSLWAKQAKKSGASVSFTPYLGPEYPDSQIRDCLAQYKLKFEKVPDPAGLVERIAMLLSRKKIIGWFQGRMEWGPRALGARSILASASENGMKDIINEKVKHRELFRPFAPVILENFVSKYFQCDSPLPSGAKYMLFVYPFTPLGKKNVPATVHVDGTGRLQSLSRNDNPLYYDMITAYYQRTGVPAIINTSFNVRGEPIVCTPHDAVHCFLKTDIDYLVIGNYIVRKQ